MTEKERQALLEEYNMLKILVDVHVTHKNQIMMEKEEFEKHVNDILDRLNEIKKLLGIQN